MLYSFQCFDYELTRRQHILDASCQLNYTSDLKTLGLGLGLGLRFRVRVRV